MPSKTTLTQASQDSSPTDFASISASGVTPSSTLLPSSEKTVASPERDNVERDLEHSPPEPTLTSPSLRSDAQAQFLQARTLTPTPESPLVAKQAASFEEDQVGQYQQDEADVVMDDRGKSFFLSSFCVLIFP